MYKIISKYLKINTRWFAFAMLNLTSRTAIQNSFYIYTIIAIIKLVVDNKEK
jgi:hypothetical protein